jgi:hypothetical protein
MTRAAADLLLDDIESEIQTRAAKLTDDEFRAWFDAEAGAAFGVASAMHRDYINERLVTMLASVGKSPS